MIRKAISVNPDPLRVFFIREKNSHPELSEGEYVSWEGFDAWVLPDLRTVEMRGYGLSRSRKASIFSHEIKNHTYTVTDVPKKLIRELVEPHLRHEARRVYEKQVTEQIEAIFQDLEAKLFAED